MKIIKKCRTKRICAALHSSPNDYFFVVFLEAADAFSGLLFVVLLVLPVDLAAVALVLLAFVPELVFVFMID